MLRSQRGGMTVFVTSKAALAVGGVPLGRVRVVEQRQRLRRCEIFDPNQSRAGDSFALPIATVARRGL